ncbi:MAG: helix-turn-helix transcriptional regulator [Clostridiales bacterium]|jgi:DNA-binding transcriptional regulator YiaG|nr:helix-turn-helix transcriptional regulator [Clostridiales bacterium]
MNIKEIREKTGLNKKEFSEKYCIPYRTIQNWEDGQRNPPEYVVMLLARVVEFENKGLKEWDKEH